ncbi:hypothetical protein Tco_0027505 [Tanacetum coccineum]
MNMATRFKMAKHSTKLHNTNNNNQEISIKPSYRQIAPRELTSGSRHDRCRCGAMVGDQINIKLAVTFCIKTGIEMHYNKTGIEFVQDQSLESEEQYTKLLEPIPEPHQVQQNDSNVISEISKEKSTVSSLLEEKKRLKSDFKIREDELLDKQIQLENKIKEFDNILKDSNYLIHSLLDVLLENAPVTRTASAAAKPCQGDSFEFYLITGSFPDGSSF